MIITNYFHYFTLFENRQKGVILIFESKILWIVCADVAQVQEVHVHNIGHVGVRGLLSTGVAPAVQSVPTEFLI